MGNTEQVSLRFLGFNIIEVDVSCKKMYDRETRVDTTITPKIYYPKNASDEFSIIMEVSLECKNVFSISFMGVGDFRINQEISDEIKRNFIHTNAPAIVFPYCRSFVSTLTSNLGDTLGTINIPPRFFDEELEEIVAERPTKTEELPEKQK